MADSRRAGTFREPLISEESYRLRCSDDGRYLRQSPARCEWMKSSWRGHKTHSGTFPTDERTPLTATADIDAHSFIRAFLVSWALWPPGLVWTEVEIKKAFTGRRRLGHVRGECRKRCLILGGLFVIFKSGRITVHGVAGK
jgi:hypothetical protein